MEDVYEQEGNERAEERGKSLCHSVAPRNRVVENLPALALVCAMANRFANFTPALVRAVVGCYLIDIELHLPFYRSIDLLLVVSR